MDEFIPFPKIPRLKRGCVITEKIDGTNAQVVVGEDGSVRAGSRNRWITPENDNFGFARWVAEHADGLRELGPGRHFGEWWGLGIQRGYGLHERRFSLFNAGRWSNERPACCHVVPVLYAGDFSTDAVDATLAALKESGSRAAPGFYKPEGIIVYMTAARHTYKVLAENDNEPKGEREVA
ncbi:RNA ligase family protein [Mesorhizobium sp. ESP-6-4]|uniref:RNA ligase family protein n=1 Tax=Mesorhizobium sp. ESP-6-4 TaxID=2876624 RepID=UPI001CCEBA57|nr:RNA ligase family protein [Mesorhizobium sp. ESP-6-4]MBZ9659748.1 RNA ligase family protein [Mesorhizobium sp. ESP-6-4]